MTVALTTGCNRSDPSSKSDRVPTNADPRYEALSEEGQRLIRAVVTSDAPRRIEASVTHVGGETIVSPFAIVDVVDADGDTHRVSNELPAFSPGSTSQGDNQRPIVERWSDGDWLYAEFTGVDVVADDSVESLLFGGFNPPGWTNPGVFKVDLDRVMSESSSETNSTGDLLRQTGGSVDVNDQLYWLAAHLDEATTDPEEPSKRTLESTWGPPNEDPVPTFLPETVGHSRVLYRFSVDDQDRLDELTVEVEIGPMPSQDSGPSATIVLDEFPNSFATTFKFSYDVDDISMPTGVADDRTDAWIEWHDQTVRNSFDL